MDLIDFSKQNLLNPFFFVHWGIDSARLNLNSGQHILPIYLNLCTINNDLFSEQECIANKL